jgi:hypothetical protein
MATTKTSPTKFRENLKQLIARGAARATPATAEGLPAKKARPEDVHPLATANSRLYGTVNGTRVEGTRLGTIFPKPAPALNPPQNPPTLPSGSTTTPATTKDPHPPLTQQGARFP